MSSEPSCQPPLLQSPLSSPLLNPKTFTLAIPPHVVQKAMFTWHEAAQLASMALPTSGISEEHTASQRIFLPLGLSLLILVFANATGFRCVLGVVIPVSVLAGTMESRRQWVLSRPVWIFTGASAVWTCRCTRGCKKLMHMGRRLEQPPSLLACPLITACRYPPIRHGPIRASTWS